MDSTRQNEPPLTAGLAAVKLDNHPWVLPGATLADAMAALEEAEHTGRLSYAFRSVVVRNKTDVLGLLRPTEVLLALEPKYKEIGEIQDIGHAGYTTAFVKDMLDHYNMWQSPLDELCTRAASTVVDAFAHPFGEVEHVDYYTPMPEAVHQLLICGCTELLVQKDGNNYGILRQADVFRTISMLLRKD